MHYGKCFVCERLVSAPLMFQGKHLCWRRDCQEKARAGHGNIRNQVRICMSALTRELREKDCVETVRRATGVQVTETQLAGVMMLALCIMEGAEEPPQ